MEIKIKRVYEEPSGSDGLRVLVDRLWPRGLRKEDARIDLWLKEAAPSYALRKWFSHDPGKWDEFRKRYFEELSKNPEPVRELAGKAGGGPVTLIYGAKDERHNNAAALKEYLSRGGRLKKTAA